MTLRDFRFGVNYVPSRDILPPPAEPRSDGATWEWLMKWMNGLGSPFYGR